MPRSYISSAPGGGSSGIAIGDTVTSATAGSVFFAGASGVLAQNNANFFFSDAGKNLKVGLNASSLTVKIGTFDSPIDNFSGLSFGGVDHGGYTAQLWGTSNITVLSGGTGVSFRTTGTSEYASYNATTFNFNAVSATRVPLKINLAAAQSADAFQVYASDGTTKLANFTATAALDMLEQTAPGAPGANSVRLYAVDNGAGKTQLMALFSSGAAQQIAIQP